MGEGKSSERAWQGDQEPPHQQDVNGGLQGVLQTHQTPSHTYGVRGCRAGNQPLGEAGSAKQVGCCEKQSPNDKERGIGASED